MKVRFKASTLVLCVLLAAGLAGIGVLLPRTVQDKRVLDTESAATPTPTVLPFPFPFPLSSFPAACVHLTF